MTSEIPRKSYIKKKQQKKGRTKKKGKKKEKRQNGIENKTKKTLPDHQVIGRVLIESTPASKKRRKRRNREPTFSRHASKQGLHRARDRKE
jgi:hypothetical protein